MSPTPNKLVQTAASITLAVSIAISVSAAAATATPVPPEDITPRKLNTAKTTAESYEKSGNNLSFAYTELQKYAYIANELTKTGDTTKADAHIAEGWRDQLEFNPTLYIAEPDHKGIFTGSDGFFTQNSSAVMLNIPQTGATVQDFYHLIPPTSGELCVLVNLEVTSEKELRNIAFGKSDSTLIQNILEASRIEGKVLISLCPSPNLMKQTRTIAQSFTDAFRYTANLIRRYAPNAQTTLTLADVRVPGTNTVELFWPGSEYVDVFAVKLATTYNKSYMPDAKAAFDCRGEYYDPILSVRHMTDELNKVAPNTPMLIAGCSFPWEGKAAVIDPAAEMKRFYQLIPTVTNSLMAVFYSNESTSAGMANLRQNSNMAAAYEECLSLPWYRSTATKSAPGATPLTGATRIDPDSTCLTLALTGKFSDIGFTAYIDGTEADPQSLTFPTGTHLLTVCLTHDKYQAKLEYTVTLTKDGRFSARQIKPSDYDYNENGYIDFGDAEILMALIAKWNVSTGTHTTDINNDGKTNTTDVSALRNMMIKP